MEQQGGRVVAGDSDCGLGVGPGLVGMELLTLWGRTAAPRVDRD